MKRVILIIAFLILLINIPMLTEANDSLATESESPLLQKQEVKLPWYKKLSYGIGYSSGLGRIVEIPLEPLSPNLWGFFVWNNIVDINLEYLPNRNWILKLEMGYLHTQGWIKDVESFHFAPIGQKVFATYVSPSILCSNGNKTKIGLEYRFMKEKGYPWGREIGILFSFTPIEREFNSQFKYGISLSVRYSLGKASYMIATEGKDFFDYDILELSLGINLYHPLITLKK